MEPRTERGGRRAQLIIVTALVLAAVFVTLALVLNSGIYTENLSSRETSDSGATVGHTLETEAAVAGAYRIANGAGETTAAGARQSFNDVVDSWAAARSREAAKDGVSAEFDRTAHPGWHLRQDENRSFSPANDDHNRSWQVASGSGNVGTFEMDVSRGELYDPNGDFSTMDDEAFHVQVDGAGGESWRLFVFRNATAGEILVHQGDPDANADLDTLRDNSSHTCTAATDRVTIDFTAEEFAGGDCAPLNFSDNVSGAVDVWYQNAHGSGGDERINGTYTLVVNGTTAIETDAADEPAAFNGSGQAAPTAQAVVYSASYTTRYERADVRFQRDDLYAVRQETYAG